MIQDNVVKLIQPAEFSDPPPSPSSQPRRVRRGGSVTGIELEMDGIVVRIGSRASPEAIGAVICALKAAS